MKKLVLSILAFSFFTSNAQPTYDWAKNIQGTGSDFAWAVTISPGGHIFVAGQSQTIGSFINKMDAAGNVIWSKSFSGGVINALAGDAAGNIYSTGYFSGTVDFDPGAGTYTLTNGSGPVGNDVFIAKLDPNGNFVWAGQLAGAGMNDGAKCITTDATGNIYIGGGFEGVMDFDFGAGTYTLDAANNSAFIAKYNSGGALSMAVQFGGTSGYAEVESIKVDAAGNIYHAGSFGSSGDFDPGAGVHTITGAGLEDIYFAKFTSSGSLVWANGVVGSGMDIAYGIGLDLTGNIYVGGKFSTPTMDFDPGAGTVNLTTTGSNMSSDVFVLKLNSAGNLIWAKNLGGNGGDSPNEMFVDNMGNTYLTGEFNSVSGDFDPNAGVYTLTSAGAADAFIVKLDASGNFVWAGLIGGTQNDTGESIAVDNSGNIYVAGYYSSSTADMDPGSGTANLNLSGFSDGFILKLLPNPSVVGEITRNLNGIVLFPNPTSGMIRLYGISEEEEVKVYNALGKNIIHTSGSRNYEFDMSTHSAGVYFIKAGGQTIKFIKQ